MEQQERQDEKQVESSNSKPARDERGRLLPGNTANRNGRKPDTPESKLVKKAIKEFIEEHKQTLAESLPKISPVLIEKALTGDVPAIKEIHDRVMGKAMQPIEATVTTDLTDELRKPKE